MPIISSIVAAVAGWVALAIPATITTTIFGVQAAILIGYGVAYAAVGLVFGGIALALGSKHDEGTGSATSPTYASTTLQSQTNNTLPIPLIYGKVKVAGNRLWQDDNVTSYVTRIVSFAEGEVNAYTDIRLNDIKQADVSGITVEKYYGTATQNISTMIPGSTNAARAEVVGGLRHHAYLAIKVPVSSKIDGSYNLTTIIEGRKVRIYTNENSYTEAYSNNPAWCLLDFLTCYNGGKIGVLNTGLRDDAKIKSAIDITSFIEAAAYCDQVISYYQYTTAFSTANSNLVWIGRHSNRALSITYVAGSTPSIALSGDDITVTFVSGTTKASDIISLVQSSPTVSAVVNVYNADSNTGVGVVSALAKTSFPVDSSDKRFTFNMIFDSNWLVSDVIEEFKKNCRGVLVKKGYKIQFKLDKPMAVSHVLTRDAIIQGSESVKTLERKERYDILDIKYIEPNITDTENESGEWAKCVARATLDQYFNEPAVSHSVEMYSVTNFKQASRNAWYYLNRNVRCYFAGSVATDHRARNYEIGDVIDLSEFVMNFEHFPVKVLSVAETQEGVFTVLWLQYDPDIYNDELASQAPVIIYTNINDPYAKPSDIQNFNASQNQRLVEFNWVGSSDESVTYEIRQGASWDSSSLIATGLSGTSYTASLTQKGAFTYWIKSKTKYSYSENATSDILNVQYLPDLNIVVTQNVIENATGTYTNTYTYNNKLKLNAAKKWQDTTPDKWQNSGARYYAEILGKWGGNVAISGNYVSQVYDIGANLQSIVSFNYDLYAPDSFSTVKIEWAYSEDNIAWSDYTLISTGSFKFRYYKVRITLDNPNGQVMYLNNLIVTVDVPDREENYTNREVVTAANGVTITYSSDIESKIADKFIITEPHIIATPKTANTYAVITASTATSCTIKLYTNSGSLTTGFVNIRAKGY